MKELLDTYWKDKNVRTARSLLATYAMVRYQLR